MTAPLLRRPGRAWKGASVSKFSRSGIWVAPDSIPSMGYCMRTPDYHYVAWMNWDTHQSLAWELYDRRRDPDENVNRSGRPEQATLLARLEAERMVGWRTMVPGRDPH
jgi:hypothetical protein